MNLLTPTQVAELLQISTRTVYENKHRLGGFYPAGIRVLRFRKEVIYGIVEGQETKRLGIRLSVQGQEVRRQGIQNQGRGKGIQGETQEGSQKHQTDPTRHGL